MRARHIELDAWLKGSLLVWGVLVFLHVAPVLSPASLDALTYRYSEPIVLTLLCGAFWTARLRQPSVRGKRFWTLVGVAYATWGIASLARLVLGEAARAPGVEMLKDVLFLLFYFAMIAALEQRPATHSDERILRIHSFGRAAGFSLLVSGLFGYLAMVPAWAGAAPYATPYEFHMALDALVALALVGRWHHTANRDWRRRYALLAAGMSLTALSDLLELAHRHAWLEYRPGAWLNLLWLASPVPLLLASRVLQVEDPEVAGREGAPEDPIQRTLASMSLRNPLVGFGLAFPTLHVVWVSLGQDDHAVLVGRSVFIACWLVLVGALLLAQHSFLIAELSRQAAVARRNAEESRVLRTQIERLSRMEQVGQMARGLAHDFRNVLMGIRSNSELALSILEDEDPGGAAPCVEFVMNAAERGADLVASLEAIGRPPQPAPPPNPVAQPLREILRTLRASLPDRIELVEQIGDSRAELRLPPSKLDRVITNLCLNARDAIPGPGRIVVSLERAALSASQCVSCGAALGGPAVVVRVADSGLGIAAGLLSQIFQPLVTTKGDGRGTGMGLAVVHGLVHDAHGHLLVESSPAGSEFRLVFPEQPPQSPVATADRANRSHLLLLEGDEALAARLTPVFLARGHRLTVASSASVVADLLRDYAFRFDLLLLGGDGAGAEQARAALVEQLPAGPALVFCDELEPPRPPRENVLPVLRFARTPLDPEGLLLATETCLALSLSGA